MTSLSTKHTQILWANVVLLAGLIGFMFYKKFARIDYALGAGLAVGILEYFVMRVSLLRKQRKDEEHGSK